MTPGPTSWISSGRTLHLDTSSIAAIALRRLSITLITIKGGSRASSRIAPQAESLLADCCTTKGKPSTSTRVTSPPPLSPTTNILAAKGVHPAKITTAATRKSFRISSPSFVNLCPPPPKPRLPQQRYHLSLRCIRSGLRSLSPPSRPWPELPAPRPAALRAAAPAHARPPEPLPPR
jgi:hypothetical protein